MYGDEEDTCRLVVDKMKTLICTLGYGLGSLPSTWMQVQVQLINDSIEIWNEPCLCIAWPSSLVTIVYDHAHQVVVQSHMNSLFFTNTCKQG